MSFSSGRLKHKGGWEQRRGDQEAVTSIQKLENKSAYENGGEGGRCGEDEGGGGGGEEEKKEVEMKSNKRAE